MGRAPRAAALPPLLCGCESEWVKRQYFTQSISTGCIWQLPWRCSRCFAICCLCYISLHEKVSFLFILLASLVLNPNCVFVRCNKQLTLNSATYTLKLHLQKIWEIRCHCHGHTDSACWEIRHINYTGKKTQHPDTERHPVPVLSGSVNGFHLSSHSCCVIADDYTAISG